MTSSKLHEASRLDHVISAALAGVAMAVVLLFFAPRAVAWRGLDIPDARSLPEVNRAVEVVRQIEHPLTPIQSTSNRVIRWRLFFPVIWHVTGLPISWFYALPFVGCFLTLWYMIHVVRVRTQSWSLAWWTAVLLGATPWFFVSTGWLTYMDSWVMLALLLFCFARPRWVLATTCLLLPWVDDRGILAIPLCLAVRGVDCFLYEHDAKSWARLRADVMVVVGLAAVYGVVRVVLAAAGTDAWSSGLLASTVGNWTNARLWLTQGLWSALRVGWLMVAVCLVLLAVNPPMRRWSALLGVLILVTIVAGVMTAGDLSRSFGLLVPVALLGVLLLAKRDAKRSWMLIMIAASANLLLPAAHIIVGVVIPIRSAMVEARGLRSPPPLLNPARFVQKAHEANARGDGAGGEAAASIAIKVDPLLAEAYFERAVARRQTRDLSGALADAEEAFRLQNSEAARALRDDVKSELGGTGSHQRE